MEAVLLDKFDQLIKRDPDLHGALQCDNYGCLIIGQGRCVFTLKALFEWISADIAMDYKAFRCALYKSTLNQKLVGLGYKIEVRHASEHIDNSTYQLVRLSST